MHGMHTTVAEVKPGRKFILVPQRYDEPHGGIRKPNSLFEKTSHSNGVAEMKRVKDDKLFTIPNDTAVFEIEA